MYEYARERPRIFTEDGQRMFLLIRDEAHRLLSEAGSCTLRKIIAVRGCTGDSWQMLACVDRLQELGEIVEVSAPGSCAAQNRVFVSGRDR